MICLLCYESNEEYISIDGEQGKKLKVSVLLYKYFRFCFDVSIQGIVIAFHTLPNREFMHLYISVSCSKNQTMVVFAKNAGKKYYIFINFTSKFSPSMK